MIKSMTGYGRADFTINNETFTIEVKAVNHRYLDLNLRVPERLFALEHRIKAEIKRRFSRGALSILVYGVGSDEASFPVNLPIARAYVDAAESLKKDLGLKGEVGLDLLLKMPEVFHASRTRMAEPDTAWDGVKTGLDKALGQVDAWRTEEGEALKHDLENRLSLLKGLLGKIEARAPEVLALYRERLKTEMERLINDRVDEARILAEAAIFAEKTDVAEEITRLKSHFAVFSGYLGEAEPVGKRLDFLCQEFFREINTIGSKASDAAVTHTVVEMKGELEKIREQVQNIE